MDITQNGLFILKLLHSFRLDVGDSITIDSLLNLAIDAGASLNQIENSLIHASSNGWIIIADGLVHLTPAGVRLLSPANDN